MAFSDCQDRAGQQAHGRSTDSSSWTRRRSPRDATPARRAIAGWRRGLAPACIVRRAARGSITDRVSLAAAGCAFYATLALFPAISMLISVYGLAFNVAAVEQQLAGAARPAAAAGLRADRRAGARTGQPAQRHAEHRPGRSASLLTFWSAATGTKSVLSALNVAYDATERRGILRLSAHRPGDDAVRGAGRRAGDRGAGVPAGGDRVRRPVRTTAPALINVVSMVLLVVLVGGSIALLYRFGPSRGQPPHRRDLARRDAGHAAVADRLGGAVVLRRRTSPASARPTGRSAPWSAIMLWFYVSAYAVLLGAELNAQLEQHGGGHRSGS